MRPRLAAPRPPGQRADSRPPLCEQPLLYDESGCYRHRRGGTGSLERVTHALDERGDIHAPELRDSNRRESRGRRLPACGPFCPPVTGSHAWNLSSGARRQPRAARPLMDAMLGRTSGMPCGSEMRMERATSRLDQVWQPGESVRIMMYSPSPRALASRPPHACDGFFQP